MKSEDSALLYPVLKRRLSLSLLFINGKWNPEGIMNAEHMLSEKKLKIFSSMKNVD